MAEARWERAKLHVDGLRWTSKYNLWYINGLIKLTTESELAVYFKSKSHLSFQWRIDPMCIGFSIRRVNKFAYGIEFVNVADLTQNYLLMRQLIGLQIVLRLVIKRYSIFHFNQIRSITVSRTVSVSSWLTSLSKLQRPPDYDRNKTISWSRRKLFLSRNLWWFAVNAFNFQ